MPRKKQRPDTSAFLEECKHFVCFDNIPSRDTKNELFCWVLESGNVRCQQASNWVNVYWPPNWPDMSDSSKC